MEKEASGPNKQVSNKCNQKDAVVPILHAVVDALERKVHEKKIGQGVDDFGGIYCGIIVLRNVC